MAADAVGIVHQGAGRVMMADGAVEDGLDMRSMVKGYLAVEPLERVYGDFVRDRRSLLRVRRQPSPNTTAQEDLGLAATTLPALPQPPTSRATTSLGFKLQDRV